MRKFETRKLEIPKEEEKLAIEEIILYFERERNEDIGNMDGLRILSFVMEKIGPYIYNQAIVDSQKFMNDKVEDLYGLMF